MFFGSTGFFLLLAVLYPLYLLVHRNVRVRTIVLLLASYGFYALWDGWMLTLVILSTLVSFSVARTLPQSPHKRTLFWGAVVFHLAILGVFKYAEFFAENFAVLLSAVGFSADAPTLHLLLPLGLSFYTFSILGYLIDVYRSKEAPTSNLLDYALAVAFFPKMAAGPIERIPTMLAQIRSDLPVRMQQFSEGVYLIVWGLIQKMVIADNVALVANDFLSGSRGIHLLSGALAVTLQIYADFSGYSDMAKGVGRLLGFDLSWNFRMPYIARGPSDFWKRWHISLSEWFRDYVYIGLGGNRQGTTRTQVNLLITMTLVGFWHGARWTFILWGAYHGALLIAYRLGSMTTWPASVARIWRGGADWFVFFCLTMIGWILFGSATVGQFASALFGSPIGILSDAWLPIVFLLWLPILLMWWFQSRKQDLLAIPHLRLGWQLGFYYVAWYMLLYLPYMRPQQFLYVQF